MRNPITRKLLLGNKLVLGGVTVAASALVGTAGMAAAQAHDPASPTPAAVAKCKQDYKLLGFKNVGQCVSAFEHQLHGYGGGNVSGSNNTVNTNVNANVKGNNNVIDTVISYVFG